jgi:hypothetical protein
VVGEGPVGLDLPDGRCGFQAHGWPTPTGCRLIGYVEPPRRQETDSELLDGVKTGNHAPRRLDLQRRRSLNQGLPSPCANLQPMLQVTLIRGQGHRGGMCRDIQRVQYLGVGADWDGLAVGRDGFGCHRLSWKQASGLHEV